MKRRIVAGWLVLVGAASTTAQTPRQETGFLDRSITVAGHTYRYQVYVPAEYTPAKPWPVLVNLHGDGAGGSDGMLPTARGLPSAIREHRASYPLIVVFPQANPNTRFFVPAMQDVVMAELDRTMKEFRTDPDRVYLSGFSMGAGSAYGIAYRWPHTFAGLIAIAGPVEFPMLDAAQRDVLRRSHSFLTEAKPYEALAKHLAHLPMLIFQGAADRPELVAQSRRLASALKDVRATHVRYTELAGADHNDSPTAVYADDATITWLLAQRRTAAGLR
jgi:predicted peptidase